MARLPLHLASFSSDLPVVILPPHLQWFPPRRCIPNLDRQVALAVQVVEVAPCVLAALTARVDLRFSMVEKVGSLS